MGGWTPISPWKLGKAQTVAIGAASASSVAVGTETRAVLISATANCHIRVGHPTQTAVAADTLILNSYPPLVFGCAPGDVVAVIQDSAAGTLYVTELTH